MPNPFVIDKILQGDCNVILKTSPVDWQQLKYSKILITGGTGYYGKWFLSSFLYINEYLKLNARLYVVSRFPNAFLSKYPYFQHQNALTFVKGDVRDFDFPKGNFDYVIHAATEVATTQEKDAPQEMLAVSEKGTQHVLNFAKGSGVKRLLLTSSGAVYGPQPHELKLMPETYGLMPVTVYGKAKQLSEDICSASGVNCSIARCYASVGPWLGLNIQYAVGNFILNLLRNEPITIKSDGRPWRSYFYTADLISWLWTILINGRANEAYNVGSENAVSIAELARIISNYSNVGHPIGIQILGKSDGAPAPVYVPDTSKAQQELGLKQNYSLQNSIAKSIDWHRNHLENQG